MTPSPTRSIGAPATPRHGSAISGPATTCTPPPRSRSMATPVRSRAISSIIRTSRGTGTKCAPPHPGGLPARRAHGARARSTWRATGVCGSSSAAPDAIKFVEGDALTSPTTSIRRRGPEVTGRPDIESGAQLPGTGSTSRASAPAPHGGKTWPPIAYQPEDADDLHPREQQPVRHAHRRSRVSPTTPGRGFSSASMGGPAVRGTGRRALMGWRQCRRGTSTPARRCGARTGTRKIAELGLDAGHRRRAGVHRRHQRPEDSRLRCGARVAPVGSTSELRDRRAAHDVHRQRPSGPRRARRLGRRPARHAEHDEPDIPRGIPARSRRRIDYGLRLP